VKPVCAVLSLDARSELRAAGHESLDTSKYPWCNDVLYLKKTRPLSCPYTGHLHEHCSSRQHHNNDTTSSNIGLDTQRIVFTMVKRRLTELTWDKYSMQGGAEEGGMRGHPGVEAAAKEGATSIRGKT